MNVVVTIDQGELDAVVAHLVTEMVEHPERHYPPCLRRGVGTLRAAACILEQPIATDAAGL